MRVAFAVALVCGIRQVQGGCGWRFWKSDCGHHEPQDQPVWKADTDKCAWACRQGWWYQSQAYGKPACCQETKNSGSPYDMCEFPKCACDAACRNCCDGNTNGRDLQAASADDKAQAGTVVTMHVFNTQLMSMVASVAALAGVLVGAALGYNAKKHPVTGRHWAPQPLYDGGGSRGAMGSNPHREAVELVAL